MEGKESIKEDLSKTLDVKDKIRKIVHGAEIRGDVSGIRRQNKVRENAFIRIDVPIAVRIGANIDDIGGHTDVRRLDISFHSGEAVPRNIPIHVDNVLSLNADDGKGLPPDEADADDIRVV